MALLVAWVSLGVCGLLSAACYFLYVDSRGQRMTLVALQAQVAGLSREVATLSFTAEPQGGNALPPPLRVLEVPVLAVLSPRISERTAPRMETADEQRARMRHHCHGGACGLFECRCACAGCVIGRGDNLAPGAARKG